MDDEKVIDLTVSDDEEDEDDEDDDMMDTKEIIDSKPKPKMTPVTMPPKPVAPAPRRMTTIKLDSAWSDWTDMTLAWPWRDRWPHQMANMWQNKPEQRYGGAQETVMFIL